MSVVVGPADAPPRSEEDVEDEARRVARTLLDEGRKPSAVAREVAERLAIGRNAAYRIVHDITES